MLPANPPGPQHHPTQHKGTQSDLPGQSHQRALHLPWGKWVHTPRSSPQNQLDRGGCPFTRLHSAFHPATAVSSLPTGLSGCPKPLTLSSSSAQAAAAAALPSPQPPGSACASSRTGLPGAAGLSVTLRPVPMALGLGDTASRLKVTSGSRGERGKGLSVYPLNGGGCVSGVGVGLFLL